MSKDTQNNGVPKSQPIRIEQPSSINGRKWFFCREYSGGFSAECGPTLDKRTVAARCAKKVGAGKLVCIRGVWHWLASDKPSDSQPMQRMVRRLDELGEQSAGELGQELWLKEYRGIPENTLATRYCRPAGKLLRAAERLGWVTNREARNRKLWRVTPKGRKAYLPNDQPNL